MILDDRMVISIASQPKMKAFSTVKAISNAVLPAKAAAIWPTAKITADNSTRPLVENTSFRYRGMMPLKYTSSAIPTNKYKNKLPST